MRMLLRLVFILAIASSLFAQQKDSTTAAPQSAKPPQTSAPQPIKELNFCYAYRLDDPKQEKCHATCDTGQMARCYSVEKDSPTPPMCQCVKAQGLEGVNPFSICKATKKNAAGKEIENCSIECDKRTIATCKDAPAAPDKTEPSCRCEKRETQTAPPANPSK